MDAMEYAGRGTDREDRPGELTRAVPWSTLTRGAEDLQRTKMAIHAAMITRMDLEIGKVLAQLKAMDAERDTVIVFLSDNGASSEQLIRGDGHDKTAPLGSARTFLGLGPGWASCSNAPFRLHKCWVNEGGIASPLIVHWPNGIKDAEQAASRSVPFRGCAADAGGSRRRQHCDGGRSGACRKEPCAGVPEGRRRAARFSVLQSQQ